MWHIRLGHVSKTYLQTASKYIPELRNIKFENDIQDCEICFQAKTVKKGCTTIRFKNTDPLKLIHTDLMCPISPCSFQFWNQYIITLTDDATRYIWTFTAK